MNSERFRFCPIPLDMSYDGKTLEIKTSKEGARDFTILIVMVVFDYLAVYVVGL